MLTAYFSQKSGVEEVDKAAGFEYWTVLRQDWLEYNYLTPGCAIHFPEYQSEHVLTISYDPSFKQRYFDPYNVGKFAAAALLEPVGFYGHVIEIAGESLTFEEVVERLSKVSDVQVPVRFRTEEEREELVESKKMPVIELQLWNREFNLEYDPKTFESMGLNLGRWTSIWRGRREDCWRR